jgi:hypothetical protein
VVPYSTLDVLVGELAILPDFEKQLQAANKLETEVVYPG